MATRERGAIGKQTFQRVQELIADGTPKQTAFARVAEESGRSKQTVQTAFYRIARTMPAKPAMPIGALVLSFDVVAKTPPMAT